MDNSERPRTGALIFEHLSGAWCFCERCHRERLVAELLAEEDELEGLPF